MPELKPFPKNPCFAPPLRNVAASYMQTRSSNGSVWKDDEDNVLDTLCIDKNEVLPRLKVCEQPAQ